jgi:hypothetical protein
MANTRFDLGSWNIINIKLNVHKKWSVFAEAQLRSLRFYHHFHYHEYKAGVSFKAHPNVVLTLAAGDYDTYREGGNFIRPKNNAEFRLWPQVILQHPIWILRIEQRYRAEFRFTSSGYRNRFRYRLGISIPFGKDKKGYKPFTAQLSNELFFTDKEPYFERNRAQIGINYKINKIVALQVGYLHQFDYKINDETGRDFLVVGCFIEISDFKKKGREKPVAPTNVPEVNTPMLPDN